MLYWDSISTKTFKKQRKNLDHQIRRQVDQIIDELQNEEHPEKIGVYKANMKAYAYHIGKKYRILYNPIYAEKVIEFYRVCDHTSVYMKD